MTASLNGLYDRIRDPAAERAARAGAGAHGFAGLRGHKYCLLVTYRRSGEPVPTPVWFGVDDGGRVYVRTEADAAKVRRVRHDDRALVGPANARGRPLGPLASGTARVLPDAERDAAERALRRNYGLGRRVYEAVLGSRGERAAYLEVTAA